MATRRAFSKEDQSNVVDWLVKHHPQKENRRGNIVWKLLTEDKDGLLKQQCDSYNLFSKMESSAHPWNSRHTWQSWREKYIDNMVHYDILISKKYRAIHGDDANPNNVTIPAPPASNSFPPKRVTNKTSQSKQSSAKPSVPKPSARPVHLNVPTSPRRPPSPQSNANSPRRAQIPQDIKSLARYFDINGIADHTRARANIFQDLKRNPTTSTWSSSRSALEWRDLYTENKEEIDNLVREGGLDVPPAPVDGNAEPRRKKRRREEEDQNSAVDNTAESSHRSPQEGVNGVKKRRLNGTERPAPHPEPPNVARPPTPSTPGLVPPHTNTLPTGRTPIILVPETPSPSNSSRGATPLAKSKLDHTGTSAFVLKTVTSALKSAYNSDLGPYGIKGSPIGSLGSGPPSPHVPPEAPKLSMINGVPRVNGQVPAMHIFPHSLPSLTPALREKTMNRDIIPTPNQGESNAVEVDNTTPDAGIARQKSMASTNQKGSSIFAQIGQETPRADVSGNLRQEIFPHTLPHLTPALRPGPHGENEYIINDDTVVFACQHDNEDQEGPVFPKSLPSLTPALRPGSHGETIYVIRDQSIQHLEINKGNSRPATPQEGQSALDDDEFEGPSPMPYLGSDRHSSRSYSFSHGQEDSLPGPLLEGLAKALSNQLLQEESVDAQEVDELANDVDDEEEGLGLNERSGPRYIVPAKRPRRPSESPLFASSSASEDDGRAGQSKSTKVGVHYPVKATVKAKGVVRVRGRKNSDRGMKPDEDSESDSEGSMGDSDKENAAAVEDFNDIFQNDSPPAIEEDSPVAKSVAPVTLQDEMDQTPDFHSSPKSLHFSGKTPPSPNITATSIKPQVPLNLAPPATAPATSKNAAAILRQYGKGFPSFDAGDRSKETLLKAALSYPSPNIPSELEEALQRKEEPSPLQRLSEKAMLGKATAKDDEHVSDAGKPRHGKVRFDGVALDRDRRKTTGGIGFAFGAGGAAVGGGSKGIVSDAVAGPSYSRFKAAPALFGSQRRSDGRVATAGSQDIHLERKSVEVMDLATDDEEEDESPLARYSAPSRAAATSPHKIQQGQGHAKSDQTMRSSGRGPPRSTIDRFPPPPTPVRVPVIASSSSPLPDSSPPVRSAGAGRNGGVGSVSTQEFGTAMWSPVRFGQASASASQAQAGHHDGADGADTLLPSGSQPNQQRNRGSFKPGFAVESGQGLSIGFRDQNDDAEWVAAVRGRPSITSKRIDPRRRSAPVPSDGEVVVYSSRSPSRSRVREGSRRSSTTAGGGLRDISGLDILGGISDADKQRILAWLSENRNPDHSPSASPSSSEEVDDESNIFEGLGLMFESMASNNGFAISVPRNVWKQCGDLVETAAVVQAMTDAANAAGLEELEMRQKRSLMDAMERRERILSGEVDGRRRSGRYSSGVGVEQPDLLSNTSGDAGAGAGANFSANIASSTRHSEGYEMGTRGRSSRTGASRSKSQSGDGRRPRSRPRPPSYVPAEVVEPLLSQL